MIENGRARLGMTVADRFLRNRKITITTRHSVTSSVTCTSLTDWWMETERSYSVLTSTDAGSWPESEATVAFTASATCTVFVPGWRWIARTMARLPSYQLALRECGTSSSPRATSWSRTGAPFWYVTASCRNSGALEIDPSASTVYARCGPHSVPVGRFGLPADTAAVTSSRPIPRAASAFGSTWIRTAYLPDPNTCTCATPLTVDKRCARNVSAYSSNTDSGSVPDVRARYRIGESAGFDLLYDGGCMPGGSWRRVLEIAACTSWAAASMSRDSVNCNVMFVPPSV